MFLHVPTKRLELLSTQDLLDYVGSFRGETSGAHPATLVTELYGDSGGSSQLHCQQLEGWYEEYANTVRRMPYLFKRPEQVEAWPYLQIQNVLVSAPHKRFRGMVYIYI